MINNKNFYYIFIFYLTISCSLYHIVYWSFFGLNGLSFVSIEDIIKTSLNSIFFTFLTAIFGYLFGIKIFNYNPKKELYNRKELIITTVEMIVFYFIISSIINYFHNSNNIQIYLLFATFIIIKWIDVDLIFDKEFDTKINKQILLLMVIYLPISTIGTAIVNSTNIYFNKEYMYSLIITKSKKAKPSFTLSQSKSLVLTGNNQFLQETNVDTIKFLGRNNDSFIFTDLKNLKIFFIKNDTIELIKKERTANSSYTRFGF